MAKPTSNGVLDKLTEHFLEAFEAGYHIHILHGNLDASQRRNAFNNWVKEKFVDLLTK